jgi:hypothetical protein
MRAGRHHHPTHVIEQSETGISGIFRNPARRPRVLLRQRLTDDLPEALLVKPGAAYLWSDSHGAFLNPATSPWSSGSPPPSALPTW